MEEDIRWQQRFSNYNKALKKLNEAIEKVEREHFSDGKINQASFSDGDDIIKEGLIQRFEYTHELAWNVMKDYAFYQGNSTIGGSRDATREALTLNLIADGQGWMNMIASRNQTSHTYNSDTANEIFESIIFYYHSLFLDFQQVMEEKRSGEQSQIDA
jgi:nucleotidyltransferase substrate binding protein (TIGR01987 family)